MDTRRFPSITRSVSADWILADFPTSRTACLLLGYSPSFQHHAVSRVFAGWMLAALQASSAALADWMLADAPKSLSACLLTADWILADLPASRAACSLSGYSPIFEHHAQLVSYFPTSRATRLLAGHSPIFHYLAQRAFAANVFLTIYGE